MNFIFIFWLAILLIISGSFYFLGSVLTPFIIAVIISHTFYPLVDKLKFLKLSRSLRAMIVISIITSSIVIIFVKVTPLVISQLKHLIKLLPTYQKLLLLKTESYLNSFNKEYNIDITDQFEQYISSIVKMIFESISNVINHLWSSGMVIVYLISMIFLIPILSFYLLKEWPEIIEATKKLIPKHFHQQIGNILSSIDTALSKYMRGQINVCLILATIYSLSLYFIGLEFALIIGVLSGFLVFLPYLGVLIGICSSLLVAYFQFGYDYHLIYIISLYIIVQVLEGSFITPYFIGEKIGLHPVWIIFLVLAGGKIFGFWGVMLAVPTGAILVVLFKMLMAYYAESKFYLNKKSKEYNK
jgi:putative permease